MQRFWRLLTWQVFLFLDACLKAVRNKFWTMLTNPCCWGHWKLKKNLGSLMENLKWDTYHLTHYKVPISSLRYFSAVIILQTPGKVDHGGINHFLSFPCHLISPRTLLTAGSKSVLGSAEQVPWVLEEPPALVSAMQAAHCNGKEGHMPKNL